MNVSDCSVDRQKAVRTAAEILRKARVAFFPLDISALIFTFSRQIQLLKYSDLELISKLSGDDEGEDDFLSISQDGFCTRYRDVLLDFVTESCIGNQWKINYNERRAKTRLRFTIPHELGHIFLGHHQILNKDTLTGMDDSPEYKAADTEADLFSINLLAPAPAAYRLLTAHGYTFCAEKLPHWQLTNPNAPFLIHLGSSSKLPEPEELLMTAFNISRAAAYRRLNELPMELEIWKELDADLYSFIEHLPHRAGWFCQICNYRRRTASLYCPKCGKDHHYTYQAKKNPSRPVIRLKENGQFSFCSVCGNAEIPEDAEYCPICGCPVINECENRYWTDGDFIRSGMYVVRGTHKCKPSDIYCGECGTLTAFGRNYGPKKNMWTDRKGSDSCRLSHTTYSVIFPVNEDRLQKCPLCGSDKTIRDGRYCAKCMLPMENHCVSEGKPVHACAPNDRYCRVCGSPTNFQKLGLFPDYRETEEYKKLIESEKRPVKPAAPLLLIQDDGRIREISQE